MAVGSVVGAALTVMAAVVAAPTASAAPTAALPDLRGLIPTGDMRIERVGGVREFRYTHDIANLGDGPLEIRPDYDTRTRTARGYQRIHRNDGGRIVHASERIVGGTFTFHPIHGHFHYPLASFAIHRSERDGSVGREVAVSPKVGYCIADNLRVAGTRDLAYSGGVCRNPRAVVGISVGWVDRYDWRDFGQSIPIGNLADGVYWLRTIVDPDNFLLEKREDNNVTDVKFRVTGDQVRAITSTTPRLSPPVVKLVSPAAGATVRGAVDLRATAPAGVRGVDFLVDGVTVGTLDTAAPFTVRWDTARATPGLHVITARAHTRDGRRGASASAAVTVTRGS